MSMPQQVGYEVFQDKDDFDSLSPIYSQNATLISQAIDKLPEKKVDSYFDLKDGTNKPNILDTKKDTNNEITPNNSNVYFIEKQPKVGRSIALQKWVGLIKSVDLDNHIFNAKLINKTNAGYDEYAEINFDEITEEDIELIEPGAVFYWTIGYHHNHNGQRTRFSQIRFRRLPNWDDDKIKAAKENANELAILIGWK